MDSKKTPKKRTLNHYRQVKDVVYKSQQTFRHSEKKYQYNKLVKDLRHLCRSNGNDQELGGAVRRLMHKHFKNEQ